MARIHAGTFAGRADADGWNVILGCFADDPKLGLVFPEDPHLNDWDENREMGDALAKRMKISMPLPTHFDFPIGTMFWARPRALKSMFDLRLAPSDFPPEPLPIDGTILHALERLLAFSNKGGLSLCDDPRPGQFEMKSHVVIGGCGFLGRHVARRLMERGDTVDVVDMVNWPKAAAVHPKIL